MLIRKCLKQEISAAGAFYNRVVAWLDTHINYPKWIYGVYPSESTVRAMVEEESQYLCLEEDRIIGAFSLNADPQGAYEKANWGHEIPPGSYMVIHSLATDPEKHSCGLGTRMIEFCEDVALKNGYLALRVDVVPENAPAKRLFRKNGFVYAGDVDLERNIENIPFFSLYEKIIAPKVKQ